MFGATKEESTQPECVHIFSKPSNPAGPGNGPANTPHAPGAGEQPGSSSGACVGADAEPEGGATGDTADDHEAVPRTPGLVGGKRALPCDFQATCIYSAESAQCVLFAPLSCIQVLQPRDVGHQAIVASRCSMLCALFIPAAACTRCHSSKHKHTASAQQLNIDAHFGGSYDCTSCPWQVSLQVVHPFVAS